MNPIDDDFGALAFGTDGSTTGVGVTDHSPLTPSGNGYLDRGTDSLRNVAFATTEQSDRVSAYVQPGPTPFQQALLDGATHGTGKRTIRTVAAFAAAMTIVAALSACSNPEDAMTPDEARDMLAATIADTAALIDGPEWAETSVPVAQECVLGGARGTKYGYTYAAPRPDRDRLADVTKVAEHWESLGMSVHVDIKSGPVVFGAGGPVQNIEFSTDPGNYLIGGTSLCAPGEVDEGDE